MDNDYRALLPHSGEDQARYALRLQERGYEEMLIRKALRHHFRMRVEDFPSFFETFVQARLGHLELLLRIHPNRSDYSLTKKLSKNLGISAERAEQLVKQFRVVPPSTGE